MTTTKPGTRFHVISTLPELEAYEPSYRRLFEASDASPYYAYDWIHAYLKHFPSVDGVFICVAIDAQGPMAIVPLVARRHALATQLELFGDGPANVNTGCGLPRAKGVPIVAMAADWVRAYHLRWDYLVCEKLPEDSCPQCRGGATTGASRIVERAMDPSLVIDLPASWEDYLASRNRNHRSNIRRCVKNLEASGEVVMRRVGLDPADDPVLLERVIEDALRVSSLSWQGSAAHGHAICDADQSGFFRESSRALAGRGILDLGVLYVDNRPVAFSWGHARAGKSWIASSGFDKALRDASPGLALDALIVKDSIARGLRQLDWGHQFPEYKQRWATSETPMFEICRYANSHMSPLKRRAQARWDRSVAPRLANLRFTPGFYVGLPEFGI
ncbi:MAG: GNAT family N-acetyltransferase [Thiotrichales bacterium]